MPAAAASGYVARVSGDGSLIDDYAGPVGNSLTIGSTGGFAALGSFVCIRGFRLAPKRPGYDPGPNHSLGRRCRLL